MLLRGTVLVAGVALTLVGLWFVYWPLSLIVAGLVISWISLVLDVGSDQ